jgi:hypothetical protein
MSSGFPIISPDRKKSLSGGRRWENQTPQRKVYWRKSKTFGTLGCLLRLPVGAGLGELGNEPFPLLSTLVNFIM